VGSASSGSARTVAAKSETRLDIGLFSGLRICRG